MEFAVDFSVTENGKRAPQWNINSDLNGDMTLEDLLQFTKNNLIVIADYALKEEQAKGFDKKPIVTVDGRVGKPVSQVSPLGRIEFTARANLNEIILEAYQGVWDRSPVDTGQYKSNNFLFLNGRQIATDLIGVQNWLRTNPTFQETDIIRIVNISPYARKLERFGITAQRRAIRTTKSKDPKGRFGFGGRILAPNGTYYLTTKQILRKYQRNSRIKFEFIPGSQLGLAGVFKTRTERRGEHGKPVTSRLPKKQQRTYLYPSIKISVSERGIR